MTAIPPQPLLDVSGLSKRYPGVQALDNVSLSLYPSEVLAVVGENGAGKSTLMKILAGIESADAGQVLMNGEPVTVDSVRAATDLGIALIHQELNLAGNLDVAANVLLGREPRRSGFVRNGDLRAEAQRALDRLNVGLSPRAIVGDLAIGHQQMVEIAKALSINARVLIMDEPTSSLSRHETDQLYRVVRNLRERGVSVIYISHRLAEVNALADRVLVLRDGKNAGELTGADITHDNMVRLMVGREVLQARRRTPLSPGDVALEVQNLASAVYPTHRVSFTLREREIVGLAGLVGAGRTELLETIFGLRPALSGYIAVGGKRSTNWDTSAAIEAGVALVPEDRKQHGLILEMSVRENTTLARLRDDHRLGFIDGQSERRLTADLTESLDIRVANSEAPVELLSGGNQQKVVWGKWLARDPKVLLLDEPTRGIDVGAKAEIYRMMEGLAEQGKAILFASSEMEEILTLSDRVLVMHEGRIAGELSHTNLSEEAIMRLATGAVAA